MEAAAAVTPANNQLASIQALRAVAALAVFVFHFTELLTSDFGLPGSGLFAIGSAGVDIFFVISGFIMCLTTDRADQRSAGQFVVKRLARIIPLYYTLTLAIFIVALTAPYLLASTTATAESLIKSLLFIPYARADGTVVPVLFLGWTLNYEMFFYALFALALLTRHPIAAVVGAILAFVTIGRFIPQGDVLVDFYTSGVMLEFVWGCLLFVAFKLRRSWLKAASFVWIIGALLMLAQNVYPVDLPREISQGLPAALIVGGLLGVDAKAGLLQRLLARLGDASYSLYLGHPYVMAVTAKVSIALLGASILSATVAGLAALVLSIVASQMLFMLFERPTNDWIRRLALGRKAPAAASGA